MMTCDDFREQMNRCLTFESLVHLFCAQWGCVKGDKPDMDRLRRDYEDRMEQLDPQPTQQAA